jgi:hypothetical protein
LVNGEGEVDGFGGAGAGEVDVYCCRSRGFGEALDDELVSRVGSGVKGCQLKIVLVDEPSGVASHTVRETITVAKNE